MALKRPIDFAAAAKWIGCSERHLLRLCTKHNIERRYRFNGLRLTKVRVLWDSEVETLQSLFIRSHRRHHATPTS